jgi:hypothetical protein
MELSPDLLFDRFVEYVPTWPAYSALEVLGARLRDEDGGHTILAADEGIVVYRLRTVVYGRERVIFVPVPEELPEPLSDWHVARSIAEAALER